MKRAVRLAHGQTIRELSGRHNDALAGKESTKRRAMPSNRRWRPPSMGACGALPLDRCQPGAFSGGEMA